MAENENQREFHRGEVWWFSDPGRYPHEYGGGRPGVIVSSEKGCETSPVVQVVLLTTSTRYGVINVPINSGDKSRTAMCSSIQSFSKERADRRMCVVTPQELAEIERGLAVVLGLRDLNEPVDSGLEEKVETLENEVTAQKVELAMYQKLYEKAVDQLAKMKLDFDISRKAVVGASQSVAPANPAPKVQEYDHGFELVDVNRCSVDDLKCVGASQSVALNIIAGRPYLNIEDLRIVPGMTKVGYGIISKKVTVGDTSEYRKPKKPVEEPKPKVEKKPESGKVNVNTIPSARQLRERTGMALRSANGIMRYRKEHGNFASLDDLLKVPEFGATCMKRYRDKLEV